MYPVVFHTLPEVFSFAAVIVLVEICALLLATGRRYLKQLSYVAVGIAGAAWGESIALTVYPDGALLAIIAGLGVGVALCRYLRPAAVGGALAYVGFFSATYLVNIEYVQYIAALVLFVYGLLLTDLAPTFVSNLLASGLLFLIGIWVGVPTTTLFVAVTLIAAARIVATAVPRSSGMKPGRGAMTTSQLGQLLGRLRA
jgi:hypothetical protein